MYLHGRQCVCERCFREKIIAATSAILHAVDRPDYAPPGAQSPPPAVTLTRSAAA